MIAAATSWLAPFDALCAPSAPGPAPEGLGTTGDPSCCTLASLLGFPAITLPVGRSAGGLPLGMQLVGLAGDDDDAAVGRALVRGRRCRRGIIAEP